jgi:hypothetical protein
MICFAHFILEKSQNPVSSAQKILFLKNVPSTQQSEVLQSAFFSARGQYDDHDVLQISPFFCK